MKHKSAIRSAARRVARTAAFLMPLLLLTSYAFGQQDYVGRWDAYGGYMYLNSPYINLGENGFHFQAGMRLTNWLSSGFDYSVGTGNNVLTPNMLIPSLQTTIGGELRQLAAAGLLPSGYQLNLPVSTKTQSFTVGPQIAYRHFSKVTFFIRPNLGTLQVVATPHPGDPIATGVVAQLAPSGKKTDWTYYWGVGGGMEFNVNRHFALRVQADVVHDYMFNDLLPGTNAIRFPIGPGFQWGRNVVKR